MRLGLLSLIEALLFLSTSFAMTFAAYAFRYQSLIDMRLDVFLTKFLDPE